MPSQILFLWDIDATLLLTGGAGKIAFERVFEKLFNEKFIWNNLTPDGRTDDWIIDDLFSSCFHRLPTPEEKKQIIQEYCNAMPQALCDAENFRLMPGVPKVLDDLRKIKNIHHGLATGNFKPSAHHKLNHAGLNHYFSFGGYGCDSPNRLVLTQLALKRGVQYLGQEPDDVYVIGDSIYDVQCGRQIGAKTIAVCTGSTPAEQLKAQGADWVLKDLREFCKGVILPLNCIDG